LKRNISIKEDKTRKEDSLEFRGYAADETRILTRLQNVLGLSKKLWDKRK
jgi:hypothetical protein